MHVDGGGATTASVRAGEAAVIEGADGRGPEVGAVVDCFGRIAFLETWYAARATKSATRRPRAARFRAYAQALLPSQTDNLSLDSEGGIDALDRLGRDQRFAELRKIEELAPALCLDDWTSIAICLVELAEAGVGVALYQSGIARQKVL